MCWRAEEEAKLWKDPTGPPRSGRSVWVLQLFASTHLSLSPLVVFPAFQLSHSTVVSSYPQFLFPWLQLPMVNHSLKNHQMENPNNNQVMVLNCTPFSVARFNLGRHHLCLALCSPPHVRGVILHVPTQLFLAFYMLFRSVTCLDYEVDCRALTFGVCTLIL